MKSDVSTACYIRVHRWIRKQLHGDMRCTDCGSTINVECANISGKFLFDKADWSALCKRCHYAHDYIPERGRHISKSLTGRKLSTTHRSAISRSSAGSNNGKTHTSEARKKISDAVIARYARQRRV